MYDSLYQLTKRNMTNYLMKENQKQKNIFLNNYA